MFILVNRNVMKEIEGIYYNRNSVNFSLCKEVFEKFGGRPARIMCERLNRDHELDDRPV